MAVIRLFFGCCSTRMGAFFSLNLYFLLLCFFGYMTWANVVRVDKFTPIYNDWMADFNCKGDPKFQATFWCNILEDSRDKLQLYGTILFGFILGYGFVYLLAVCGVAKGLIWPVVPFIIYDGLRNLFQTFGGITFFVFWGVYTGSGLNIYVMMGFALANLMVMLTSWYFWINIISYCQLLRLINKTTNIHKVVNSPTHSVKPFVVDPDLDAESPYDNLSQQTAIDDTASIKSAAPSTIPAKSEHLGSKLSVKKAAEVNE